MSHGVSGKKTDTRSAKVMCLLNESDKARPEHGQIEVDEDSSKVLKKTLEDGLAVELCCGILEGVTKLS